MLVQGISIANEITGTYRSGIRPDGLLGFGLVTSRPSPPPSPFPSPSAHWTTTKHGNAYCAPTCLRPHCFAPEISIDFRPEDAVKRATHSFPISPSQFRKILFQYRVWKLAFSRNSKLVFHHTFEQLETELKIFFVALNYVDLNSVFFPLHNTLFLSSLFLYPTRKFEFPGRSYVNLNTRVILLAARKSVGFNTLFSFYTAIRIPRLTRSFEQK